MLNNFKFQNLFKKNKLPKFEFYNLFPGHELIYPPEKAGLFIPKWLKQHTSTYKKNIESAKNSPDIKPMFSMSKCPGIKQIINRGIHLKCWQDLYIELYPDGSFSWKSPMSLKNLPYGDLVTPEIQHHSGAQFPEFALSRDDTFSTIIKVMTPWRCKMPDDWAFLLSPIHYGDDPWFTPLSGIWDASFGAQLNINLQIHKKVGKFFMKAGTPLVKLIPIQKKEEFDLEIRHAHLPELDEERFVHNILHNKANTDHKYTQSKIKDYRDKFKQCPFIMYKFK